MKESQGKCLILKSSGAKISRTLWDTNKNIWDTIKNQQIIEIEEIQFKDIEKFLDKS